MSLTLYLYTFTYFLRQKIRFTFEQHWCRGLVSAFISQVRDMLNIAELPQSGKYGGENQNYVTFRKSRNLLWGKRIRVIAFHASIFKLMQYQKNQIRSPVRVPNQIWFFVHNLRQLEYAQFFFNMLQEKWKICSWNPASSVLFSCSWVQRNLNDKRRKCSPCVRWKIAF